MTTSAEPTAEVSAGAERAAIVLLALGEEAAGGVLAALPRETRRALAAALEALETRARPGELDVLREFTGWLAARSALLGGGRRDFYRRATRHALATGSDRQSPARLHFAFALRPEVLFGALEKEHPQTVALALAELPDHQAAAVLALFPAERRSELLQRIAERRPVAAEILETLAEGLENELSEMAYAHDPGGERGVSLAADILSSLSSQNRAAAAEALHGVEDQNPLLAARLREHLFRFDHMLHLEDRDLQILLREVDSESLVISLAGAEPALVEKFLHNMSARAAQMLREDIEEGRRPRSEETQTARAELVRIALDLDAEGRITLPSGAARRRELRR